MLGQNQTNLDTVIGSANYDIGHVFSTGGGGVADLGVVCRDRIEGPRRHRPSHARSATPSTSTTSPTRWATSSAATTPSTATPATAAAATATRRTAYEPGSGSTIMAYAGICGADRPAAPQRRLLPLDQLRRDRRVHDDGHRQQLRACSTATGNSLPVPSTPGGGFTIPQQHAVHAHRDPATDPNGDALTYCWEESDLGAGRDPGRPTTNRARSSAPATRPPARRAPSRGSRICSTTRRTIGEMLPNADAAPSTSA